MAYERSCSLEIRSPIIARSFGIEYTYEQCSDACTGRQNLLSRSKSDLKLKTKRPSRRSECKVREWQRRTRFENSEVLIIPLCLGQYTSRDRLQIHLDPPFTQLTSSSITCPPLLTTLLVLSFQSSYDVLTDRIHSLDELHVPMAQPVVQLSETIL